MTVRLPCISHLTRIAVTACALLLGTVVSVRAQTLPGGLTPAQIEALRRNPELVRQQLQQSGLSPDQIRSRLRDAGYPENALDAYLTSGQTGLPAPTLGTTELAAFAALGLPFQTARALLPVDSGLVTRPQLRSRVFGVDAFRRSTTQFLPLLSGPVPPDYQLGPGDVLVLILTGDVELAHTLTVTREGFVLIPQVGQVEVANLTLAQLRDVLYTRLGRVYSGVRRTADATTRFDVSVANVRANQVFVIGEVVQPGAYQVSALGTVLTALYAAGGITEDGSARHIEVRRNGEVVDSLDLYDYLLRGDVRGDVRLQTGDVVFAGVRGPQVDVSGAVVRPAIYETAGGEGLSDVIAAAGGFLPSADLRTVTVYRFLPASQRGPSPAPRAAISVALSVDRRSRSDGGAGDIAIPDFEVRDGDSVVVHTVPPLGETYYVGVSGMVQRPGRYPWTAGMTLHDLLRLGGGTRVGADLRSAEVARMPADRSGGVLADTVRVPMDSSYLSSELGEGSFAAPPGPTFAPAGSAPEFVLAPYDEVLILKQPHFEFQRSVTILGEVLFPGTYTLTRKDSRLSDLVERAGGLTETAYPAGARFYRLFEYAGMRDSASGLQPFREDRRQQQPPQQPPRPRASQRMGVDTVPPLELPENQDRVNVSLPDALASPGSAADIVLQPGDSVFVPEYLPTVRVSGAVIAPTSVQYVPGKDAMYYLQNAGGFRQDADKGRTVVRQANGSARTRSKFLLWSSWPRPGPGAEVYVPAKVRREGTNWLPVLAAVASMLASTATVMLAIANF